MTRGFLKFRYKYVFVAFLALAVLAIIATPALLAQTASTGAIKGTVTDSSGAVVPNATVTATNNGTGAARTEKSGADGTYIVSLLPLGTYSLKIEATGFKTQQVPSITVNVSETSVFNPALEVGGQTQEVTVQATAEALQTTNATMGTVVASNTATALPLTTRNYTNLLGLSTGTATAVFNATSLGKGTTDLAVNGANIGQNGVSMDGVSISNTTTSGLLSDTGSAPSIGLVQPDAIQEFKIQTSLFDAGYGRNVGANTNVVTKSGTNDFHGTAFEFFRNTVLNANDFFRKETLPVNGVPNNSRQVLDQNQFGGVIGGPIKKDKLFFFGSFQELSQKNGIASQGYSTPFLLPIFPGGDRSNTAALAASLGATFCPTGTDGGISGAAKTATGAVQVACNGANINPVAIALLQYKNPDGSYYIPSGPASITSSSGTTVGQLTTLTDPARFTEHQYLGNGDYVINSKNTFSLRYFYANDPEQISYLCGLKGGAPGVCYNDITGSSNISNHYAVLKLTSILTSNLVNEARFSLQRDTLTAIPTTPLTNTQFGIQSIQPSVPALDQLSVTGLFTVGTAAGIPSIQAVTNWELGDDLSWTHGKQTIRFGGEFERDTWNWQPQFLSVGSLSFKTFQDFLLGLPGCAPGNTTCSPTNPGGTNGSSVSNINSSGTYQSFTPPGGLKHYFRDPYGNAYVQDDIKLTSRLTVNLGLRWEYDSLWYDQGGLNTNIWPSLINTVPVPGTSAATGSLAGLVVPSNFPFSKFAAPPVGGVYQLNHKGFTEGTTPLDNFGPRIAFAWSPLAGKNLVLRSGFGTFYDRPAATIYLGGITQAVPYATPIFASGAANYYSSLAVPYESAPASLWNPRWVNFANSTYSSLSETDILPSYNHTPRVFQWNQTLQYEFVHDWTLELGYVGTRGVHQQGIPGFTGQQANEAQLAGNPLGTNTLNAPAITAGLVTTNTVANAFERVPYLGFQPTGLLEFANDTDTKFNSLQVTLRKQLSHGLQVQAAYTWAKATATEWLYNDPNVAHEGPNPAYRPQRLAISYLWNLPTISNEGFVGKVVNGWSVSGVTVAQDGIPLTIINTTGGSIYGFGAGSPQDSTAEFCPGMGPANAASSGSILQRLGGSINGGQGYFNKAAFCAPPAVGNGTGWGDAGLGILLGPGQFNWDMSLIKTTKVGGIHEGASLQFRAEFFNAFNHPQFNPPGITTNLLATSAGVDSSNATFGQITSASVNPRLIQFGLKYIF
jgi:hypothetical protein